MKLVDLLARIDLKDDAACKAHALRGRSRARCSLFLDVTALWDEMRNTRVKGNVDEAVSKVGFAQFQRTRGSDEAVFSPRRRSVSAYVTLAVTGNGAEVASFGDPEVSTRRLGIFLTVRTHFLILTRLVV